MPKLPMESPTTSNMKEKSLPNGKAKSQPKGKAESKPASESSKANGKKPSKNSAGESETSAPLGKGKKIVEREVLYPQLEILLYSNGVPANGYPNPEPLTADDVKEILGWQEDPEGNLSFKENYLLKDRNGKKIRCANNQRNRQYSPALGEAYMLEILRQKWRLNGETIILDKYGEVQSGQHRLVGLILAVQEWHRDQTRPKGEQLWQELWPDEPTMETVVVAGIEAGDDVINTLDTGRPRDFVDVLYRSDYFRDMPQDVKAESARSCKNALGLVWERTQRSETSLAPKRPHSESSDFLQQHITLLKCVEFIRNEGEGTKITQLIGTSLGYAAGLLYLMGSAASDGELYASCPDESSMDWSLLDKAEEFWVDLASNGKGTEPLREALLSVPDELLGRPGRLLKMGMIIKGWNLYSNNKKLVWDREAKDGNCLIDWEFDLDKKFIMSESPRIGGIDIEYATEDEPPTEMEKPSSTSYGVPTHEPCPAGGDHDYIDDEDSPGAKVCSKCLDPKPVTRKKG